MTGLLLQTLLGSLGGIISAVVGWLLQRQLRAVLDSAGAAESKALDAQAAASGAGTAAEKTREDVRGLIAAMDRMAERHDRLWAKFLTKESYDLRLRRIEEYLAQHESERRAAGLDAFTLPPSWQEQTDPGAAPDAYTTGRIPNLTRRTA